MDSEQSTRKHVITPANWKQYTDRIHEMTMLKMEIDPTSFEAAIFLGLAQAGEAGELANVIKKMWRDGQNPELHKQMRGEIADVMIYLDHLLATFRISAVAVICEKVQELVERWPEYFEDFEPQSVN